jgi:DNA-directed RNA polymerase specialized sigma24 family protein
VGLRFFGDLDIEETAEAPGVSPGTVKRDRHVTETRLRRETGRGAYSDT